MANADGDSWISEEPPASELPDAKHLSASCCCAEPGDPNSCTEVTPSMGSSCWSSQTTPDNEKEARNPDCAAACSEVWWSADSRAQSTASRRGRPSRMTISSEADLRLAVASEQVARLRRPPATVSSSTPTSPKPCVTNGDPIESELAARVQSLRLKRPIDWSRRDDQVTMPSKRPASAPVTPFLPSVEELLRPAEAPSGFDPSLHNDPRAGRLPPALLSLALLSPALPPPPPALLSPALLCPAPAPLAPLALDPEMKPEVNPAPLCPTLEPGHDRWLCGASAAAAPPTLVPVRSEDGRWLCVPSTSMAPCCATAGSRTACTGGEPGTASLSSVSRAGQTSPLARRLLQRQTPERVEDALNSTSYWPQAGHRYKRHQGHPEPAVHGGNAFGALLAARQKQQTEPPGSDSSE